MYTSAKIKVLNDQEFVEQEVFALNKTMCRVCRLVQCNASREIKFILYTQNCFFMNLIINMKATQ